MRTRILGDGNTIESYTHYLKNTYSASWFADYPVLFASTTFKRVMLDVVTPNYKKLSAEGKIINSPMIDVVRTTQTKPALISSVGYGYPRPAPGVGTCTYNDGFILPSNIPDLMTWNDVDSFLDDFEGEDSLAITNAWANVDISEAAALASLGEMPETIKWLNSIFYRAMKVFKLFFSYRKAPLSAIKDTYKVSKKYLKSNGSANVSRNFAKLSTDFWLELRYALRPLIYECVQAVNALHTQVKRATRQTARGHDEIKENSSTATEETYLSCARVQTTRIRTRKTSYRAGVLYEIDSDINGILSLWGFDQPFDTIWELTPFSFIIDWFFNVGNTIGSWTTNASLTPLSSWVTQIHTLTEYASCSTPSAVGGFYYIGTISWDSLPGYTKTEMRIKRRLPSPDRAILPTFKLKLDVAKIADLSIISFNLLHGGVKSYVRRG